MHDGPEGVDGSSCGGIQCIKAVVGELEKE